MVERSIAHAGRACIACITCIALASRAAVAQATPPSRAGAAERVIVAASATGPITLDGRIDEPAWAHADVAGDFVQQYPTPDAAPTQRTEARVLYDHDALYVAMRMFDSHPDSIAATLARRDYTGYSDWAQVVIDSYHDRRTAFRFAVNPAGVRKDVFEFDDTDEDVGWDAVWEAAAHIDSLGWTAELRIPLSQLRYGASSGEQTWGIEFIRDIARRDERDNWAPIPADFSAFVSRFGALRGLSGMGGARRVELQPYTLARVARAPGSPADPFWSRNALSGGVGADLKYGITSNLTLTATINPDFGQVEADPSKVNLSAFELFLDERRPFFTEGSDIFGFPIALDWTLRNNYFGDDRPFYSRRVGRAPEGKVPDDAAFRDVPEATTILGAAKLSGKTRDGWSVGVLDAASARETARWSDGSAVRRREVEPFGNVVVARLIKDFRAGKSAVGGIFTALNRHIDAPSLDFLGRAAYTAGLDLRHRFDRSYEAAAAFLASHVAGDTAAIARLQCSSAHYFQRPDARNFRYDPTRTSLDGVEAHARLSKYAGAWRWGIVGHAITPGFDANDAGFTRAADWLMQVDWIGYEHLAPGRHVRSWNLYANQRSGWSTGGEHLSTVVSLSGAVELNDLWGGDAGFDQELPALSTSVLRGGPAMRLPSLTMAWADLHSDARRPLSLQLSTSAWREAESSGRGWSVSPTFTLRPSSRVELTVGPALNRNEDAWQYVATPTAAGAPRYIFGRIAQTTASLTTRVDYTFTPRLSLQLYGAPFVSAGRFSRFRMVTDPRARRFADRFHTFGAGELSRDAATRRWAADLDGNGAPDLSFADPDFSIRQFRSNAVLRWEYRPGSTLYLVWTQSRDSTDALGAFRPAHDAAALLAAKATNVVTAKISVYF